MLIPLKVLLEGRKRKRRGHVGRAEIVKKKQAKKERQQQDKTGQKPKEQKPVQPKKKKQRKQARGGQAKARPQTKVRPGGLKGKEPADQVGAQLAHCVLAVRGRSPTQVKGKKKRKKYGTRAAWNICRWSLTRHGYLKPPYKINQQLKNLRGTQKGTRANMKHAMEKKGVLKHKRFRDLFRDIEADVVAGRGREYKR